MAAATVWAMLGALLGTAFGAAASTSIERPPPVEATDFSAVDLEGLERRLSDLRGDLTIVTLWATWCFPCRYEMPLLEKVYRKLKDRGLNVVAIAVDDQLEAVRAYQAERNFSFSLLYDAVGQSKRALGVKGVPATFVMTRDFRFVPLKDPISGERSELIDNPLVWQQPEIVSQLESLLDRVAAK